MHRTSGVLLHPTSLPGPHGMGALGAEARRFVAVRVDLSTDQATEAKWALLKDYNQPGLPLVVLHHSDGSEAARVTGMLESEEFLEQPALPGRISQILSDAPR